VNKMVIRRGMGVESAESELHTSWQVVFVAR